MNSSTLLSKPTVIQALGYGFLSVTLINFSAVFGGFFTFFQKRKTYIDFLSFMIAIAVGSLVSSSMIVLIPESLSLASMPGRQQNWYIMNTVFVIFGLLIFYILEFFLHRIPYFVKRRKERNVNSLHNTTTIRPSMNDSNLKNQIFGCGDQMGGLEIEGPRENNSFIVADKENSLEDREVLQLCDNNFVKPALSDGLIIKPSVGGSKKIIHYIKEMHVVGWMILIGDAVHNFMDGLSIGVAFRESFSLGINLSVAVLCEELPHELGDFAILLRSGLNIWTAMLFNFISACTAYLGLFIGIYFGDIDYLASFIFAVTAGFFLYISLADMLPQMRKFEDRAIHESGNIWIPFIINLVGLGFGFGCIVTVTLVSSQYLGV